MEDHRQKFRKEKNLTCNKWRESDFNRTGSPSKKTWKVFKEQNHKIIKVTDCTSGSSWWQKTVLLHGYPVQQGYAMSLVISIAFLLVVPAYKEMFELSFIWGTGTRHNFVLRLGCKICVYGFPPYWRTYCSSLLIMVVSFASMKFPWFKSSAFAQGAALAASSHQGFSVLLNWPPLKWQ